ncbi:MAG TPA: choice-of-anchor V domain-containing protein [Blastocatellia bacterium]|nr:choice-of-anchor V domain-containing protein [Blastocatellia bacterium]
MGSFLPKSTIIAAFCALFILFELNSSPAGAFSSGMFPSRSGAPALGGFPQETSCVECHTGTVNSGGGSLTITAPANYSPGQNVPVTVTINQASRVFFGFELTALNDQGQKAGDLIPSDARTQLVNGASPFAGRQYIQHSFSGIIAPSSGQNSWSFIWKAPAQSAGRVTFYAAGNASNADGGTTGDLTYTTSRSINSGSTPAPTPTPVGQFTSASAASFVATVPLPPNGIVAGFGTGLSANTAFAATLPLPTSLAGVEVLVRDANSQTLNAGLFFVSANQINYLVPAGVANGAATITVRRNGVNIAQGIGNIDTISPGLFTANVSGQGVAAAVILRRRNGVDSFEPVAQFNSTASRFDPIQIDLGTDADQVFLIAFGSGFRAAAQTALSATIGGTPSPFVVSAPAPGFVGLDQVNMLIPRSLIGRKLVDVLFKVADRTANTVQISVK